MNESESWYDVAQVCLNGHVINDSSKEYSQHNQKHCDKCGGETITNCPNCNTEIKGNYHVDGVFGSSGYYLPSFCYECGKPFPWTKSKLDAAKDLADLADELDKEEKLELSNSLDDLIKDSPKTNVAIVKFKKLITKVGKPVAEGIKDILISIATEAVKKQLGL